MILMLEIAGGIFIAVVGGWLLIVAFSMLVGALRPKPKYVPYEHIKIEKIDPGNVDRPLR
jgi:hypothetical protein